MKKIVTGSLLAAIGLSVACVAQAQVKPDTLVKQRQAAMTLIGKYWGPIGGMATGKAPYNAEMVARNAGYLDALSKMPWDGFDASTKEVKSAALPAVFTDTAKFKEGADRMQAEVAKLVSASKGGDENAVKSQLAAVGKTCGGCHETFREKR